MAGRASAWALLRKRVRRSALGTSTISISMPVSSSYRSAMCWSAPPCCASPDWTMLKVTSSEPPPSEHAARASSAAAVVTANRRVVRALIVGTPLAVSGAGRPWHSFCIGMIGNLLAHTGCRDRNVTLAPWLRSRRLAPESPVWRPRSPPEVPRTVERIAATWLDIDPIRKSGSMRQCCLTHEHTRRAPTEGGATMTTASAGDRFHATTATTRTVTSINRTAILDTLESRGPLSRSQLREITGLGSATVQRLCSALLDEGFIAIEGVQSPTIGRPSHLFRYAGEGRLIGAVDLTDSRAHAALVDLAGSTVQEFSTEFARPDGSVDPDARLDGALTAIDDLAKRAEVLGLPCLAIGISAPGLVSSDGTVSNSVELGWHAVPLGDVLRSRFDIPILIENDANAVAFAEWSLSDNGTC